MYDKKSMYNVLTLLDDEQEHRNSENFLDGLSHKNNFLKLYDLLNFIGDFGEDAEILECYDNESDNELTKSFRRLVIVYNKNILKILNKHKDDLNIEINNDKESIEIILINNYDE